MNLYMKEIRVLKNKSYSLNSTAPDYKFWLSFSNFIVLFEACFPKFAPHICLPVHFILSVHAFKIMVENIEFCFINVHLYCWLSCKDSCA